MAATMGGLLGAGIATGIWRFGSLGGCGSDDSGARAFPPIDGSLSGDARIVLDLDCGDLTLSPAAGSTYHIEGTDDGGRGPQARTASDSLDVRSRQGGGFFGGAHESWRMTLGTEVAASLDISVNAGSAHLDLASMHVPRLKISANAGDATIDMGQVASAGELTASANAGTVRVSPCRCETCAAACRRMPAPSSCAHRRPSGCASTRART